MTLFARFLAGQPLSPAESWIVVGVSFVCTMAVALACVGIALMLEIWPERRH